MCSFVVFVFKNNDLLYCSPVSDMTLNTTEQSHQTDVPGGYEEWQTGNSDKRNSPLECNTDNASYHNRGRALNDTTRIPSSAPLYLQYENKLTLQA